MLATPGTVARDYTRDLIKRFAADCTVTLVGSLRLADLAETAMSGGTIDDADIAAEIAPCFVSEGDKRTDAIVLACTHYPLLRDRLERLAPWPVFWIDPAPAIARRLDVVLAERGLGPSPGGEIADAVAIFTSGRQMQPHLRATLDRYRLRGLIEAPPVA